MSIFKSLSRYALLGALVPLFGCGAANQVIFDYEPYSKFVSTPQLAPVAIYANGCIPKLQAECEQLFARLRTDLDKGGVRYFFKSYDIHRTSPYSETLSAFGLDPDDTAVRMADQVDRAAEAAIGAKIRLVIDGAAYHWPQANSPALLPNQPGVVVTIKNPGRAVIIKVSMFNTETGRPYGYTHFLGPWLRVAPPPSLLAGILGDGTPQQPAFETPLSGAEVGAAIAQTILTPACAPIRYNRTDNDLGQPYGPCGVFELLTNFQPKAFPPA